MSAKQWLLGTALAVFSAAFLAGCYTVLQHPQTEVSAEVPYDAESAACASCHDDAELYHFRDPFMDSYGYRNYGMTRWYGYYGLPWWYDGAYFYPDHSDDGYESTESRRPWGRGNAATTPLPRVGGTTNIPRVGAAPATTSDGKDDSKGEDRKKEKKKKRRLWGRGG